MLRQTCGCVYAHRYRYVQVLEVIWHTLLAIFAVANCVWRKVDSCLQQQS